MERHEHLRHEARRHAENTIADVNRHLANPRIARNPRHHANLTRMKHDAVNELRIHDDLDRRTMDDAENARRGYRRRRYPRMDADMDYGDIADTLNRVLPHLDDYADAENRRRGVRVHGYTRRPPRADMDDYADDMDDMDAENRRGGSRHRDSRGRFTRADINAVTTMVSDKINDMVRNGVFPPHYQPPVMPRPHSRYDNTHNDADNDVNNDRRRIGV